MSDSCSDSRAALIERLRACRHMVVTTHMRTDGDAIGSALALHLGALAAGKDSQLALSDEPPRRYEFLLRHAAGAMRGTVAQPATRFAELADAADLVAVVDTCAFAQMESIAAELKPRRDKIVVVDHHITRDDMGAVVWTDSSAAAAGVMIRELLDALGWNPGIAGDEAIMCAVCSDTGWLRYSNTDRRALAIVGRCIDAGIEPDVLYAEIYQSDRPQRFRLLAAAMGSMTFHAGNRLIVMGLNGQDFVRTGAREDETEEFVNEPLRIATAEVTALLTEQQDGVTRGSLRSRGKINVAALAQHFGGGGHHRAAGFRTNGDLESVKRTLVRIVTDALAAAGVS